MTVNELIEELMRCPQGCKVHIEGNGNYGVNEITAIRRRLTEEDIFISMYGEP